MRVTRLQMRDFRNYEVAELELPAGLTVVAGPNGAGKTNLLEALYFGCTARSPRTSNERELVRRGGSVARVVVDTRDEEGAHRIEVGFEPGEPKRLRVDGSPVDNLSAVVVRPLVSVFLPERLELVKGAPAARRAHLDQLIAALWPGRAETRVAYSRALAQRNALLGRIRAGASGPAALDAWDAELARHGVQLMADRREAVEGLRPPFAELAARLGLPAAAELRYRPRSDARRRARARRRAGRAPQRRTWSAASPRTARTATSCSCCWTGCSCGPTARRDSSGPHCSRCCSRSARYWRSDAARPPLMLLDDVMSELDTSTPGTARPACCGPAARRS